MDFNKLEILSAPLLEEFKTQITGDLERAIVKAQEWDMPVDYFKFYKTLSSVYSSKIEGEDIDFDSFFKHKFLNVEYKVDYTRKANDLYEAYDFIDEHPISLDNVKAAHAIITRNLLPESQQGLVRTNPMFVINEEDRIEYVAADAAILSKELTRLFNDIKVLIQSELGIKEVFFFASLIHLVFVKIHPFQDGNGRTARLLEKWFLLQKLGERAAGIQLEKSYFKNLKAYYRNIKFLGLEYDKLDYSKALDFLMMSAVGLLEQERE